MPTKVYWYLQNKIVVNEHSGRLRLEGLVEAVNVTLEMAKEVGESFHLFIDATNLEHTPTQIGDLSKIANGLLANAHLDKVFVITTNPIHRFVGNAVIQILRKPVKVVKTLDEACDSLQRLEPSLSNLAAIQPDKSSAVTVE